jgi:hypothetical protein
VAKIKSDQWENIGNHLLPGKWKEEAAITERGMMVKK